MLEHGFVKLHRSLLKWRWYDDMNTKALFIHLILTVSIGDSEWHDRIIKRGSRATSYLSLAEELRLSVQNIRTAIYHLKSTGEITVERTNKYSVITVNNFEKFQEVTGKSIGKKPTGNSRATFNQQQYKKDKEDIKKVKEGNPAFAEMSVDDIERRIAEARE